MEITHVGIAGCAQYLSGPVKPGQLPALGFCPTISDTSEQRSRESAKVKGAVVAHRVRHGYGIPGQRTPGDVEMARHKRASAIEDEHAGLDIRSGRIGCCQAFRLAAF